MLIARHVVATAMGALVAGLGIAFAAPASAANLGSYTANCDSGGRVNETISGSIGDTFTVTASNAVCFAASTPSGVVSSSVPSANPGSSTTVTLVAAGSTVFQWQQNGNGIYFAVTVAGAEAPAPIPAWVQAYGRFGADAKCADGWSPSWQSWAESVTGGWVCDRSIPSLG